MKNKEGTIRILFLLDLLTPYIVIYRPICSRRNSINWNRVLTNVFCLGNIMVQNSWNSINNVELLFQSILLIFPDDLQRKKE